MGSLSGSSCPSRPLSVRPATSPPSPFPLPPSIPYTNTTDLRKSRGSFRARQGRVQNPGSAVRSLKPLELCCSHVYSPLTRRPLLTRDELVLSWLTSPDLIGFPLIFSTMFWCPSRLCVMVFLWCSFLTLYTRYTFCEATLNSFDFSNIIHIMWRPNICIIF